MCLVFHLNRFAGSSELGVTFAAAEDLPEPFVDQAITLAALRAGQQQAAVIGFNGGHDLQISLSNGTTSRFGMT